ncbi:MAG TPA: hypothetical protein VN701_01805 [Candidatus Paceibacterota bacterium]|nr:hypothetical protein [Candidatus Paceibacterota bacterium]
MDFHIAMAVAASVLTVISAVPYVRDMVKGTTKPNIVSWGLWTLIQGIFTAAQFSAGASLSIVLPAVEVVSTGLIVVLGLIGYGYKKYRPLDFICLALAFGAIVLWQVTRDPLVALWLSVAADFCAAVPTLVKAYRDPKSETPLAYLLVALSAIAAAFATLIINLPNMLWPAYIFVINGATLTLILLGKRAKNRPK